MTDVQAQLAQLTTAFRERLPERWEAIAATWSDLIDTEDTRRALTELLDQLHGLKGSSGTFGMPVLSEVAGRFEAEARECLVQFNAGTLGAAEMGDLLTPFHIELRREVQQAMASGNRPVQARATPASAPSPTDRTVVFISAEDTPLDDLTREVIEAGGLDVVSRTLAECEVSNPAPPARVALVAAGTGPEPVIPLMVPLQRLKEAGIRTIVICDRTDLDSQLALVRAGVMACVSSPTSPDEILRHLLRVIGPVEQAGIRIMIVDDQAEVAEYFETLLRDQGMAVQVESDPEGLFHKIDRFEPDILLLDIQMPKASGPEIAQMVRLHERYSALPILFLSGQHFESQQRSGLIGVGSDDLLEKGMNPDDLIQQVRVRAQRARSLRQQVRTDGLSGLFNHRHILHQAQRYCDLANRNGQTFALVLIDLDHFKQINDRHGHDTGDVVIRTLATLLRSRLRSTDLIGRYGGEEFLLILPDTDAATAQELTRRLLARFRKQSFRGPQGAFNATFSAGICDASVSVDWEGLFQALDQALYRAKERGRDQVCRV